MSFTPIESKGIIGIYLSISCTYLHLPSAWVAPARGYRISLAGHTNRFGSRLKKKEKLKVEFKYF